MIKLTATATFTPRITSQALIQGSIKPALMKGADMIGQLVEDEAKSICPVKTGRLRSSITHIVQDDSTGVVTYVFATAPYAAYVEYGTGIAGAGSPGAGPYPYSPTWPGMPAQPFLRPAIDSARPFIIGYLLP